MDLLRFRMGKGAFLQGVPYFRLRVASIRCEKLVHTIKALEMNGGSFCIQFYGFELVSATHENKSLHIDRAETLAR